MGLVRGTPTVLPSSDTDIPFCGMNPMAAVASFGVFKHRAARNGSHSAEPGLRYLNTVFRPFGQGVPKIDRFARWFFGLGGVAVDDCPQEKSPHQINAAGGCAALLHSNHRAMPPPQSDIPARNRSNIRGCRYHSLAANKTPQTYYVVGALSCCLLPETLNTE